MTYGDHDVMQTGTNDAPITPITMTVFNIINCLSHHTNPTTVARPFKPRAQLPSRIFFVDASECTATGKFDHQRLRR
jgi:hypothetical protein